MDCRWSVLALLFSASVAAHPVEIVYTGGSGGVGRAQYNFSAHSYVPESAGLKAVRPLHGVFHQGANAVWGADHTVASTVAFLEADEPKCEDTRAGIALSTPTERVLLPDSGPLDPETAVPGSDPSPVTWRKCVAGGVEAIWVGPAQGDPINWSIDAFTVRLGALYSVGEEEAPLVILGLPRQETSRRIQAIRDTMTARPGSVFIDAGGFVPGASSVAHGAMSLHRPTAFDALESLKPPVLAPAASELAPGPAAFLAEAADHDLTYVATNWSTDDDALALSSVVRIELNTVDIAFLGLIDPELGQVGEALEGTGVTLTEPVAAVQAAADELAASDDPPDLVVLLAYTTPSLHARLRRLHGVDLLFGNRDDATLRVRSLDVAVREMSDFEDAGPIAMPMDGVAVARMDLENTGLGHVAVRPLHIYADAPSAPDISALITKVRASVYPGRDGVLVPGPAEPLGEVTDDTLDRLICEAVLEETAADAVFLPPLAHAVRLPGPLTELQVSDRLAMLDVLEVHKVDGDRMGDFLLAVFGEVENNCGASTGSRFPKVRGRPVDSNRTYHVVTTDHLRKSTAIGSLLDVGSADLVLHHPKYSPLLDADDRPRLLSSMALGVLQRWRDTHESGWVEQVVARSPANKPPLWLLDVEQASLSTQSFRRSERPEAYSNVPETKINSPNSFTLGAEATVALEYSDANVRWDLRGHGAFTRLQLADEEPQETADDLQSSTSVALPRLAFPIGAGLRWMPYAEVLHDSELTPGVDDAGGALPRQSDLSLTVGLSTARWRFVRLLRVGGFGNQDLGRLPNNKAGVAQKSPEYGARLEAETRHDFFEASSVRFETHWDAQYFAATPLDDAADLRMRLAGEARLKLRLIRWLDGVLYAEGLLVKGRVEDTKQLAGATTFGAELDIGSAFRLNHGNAQ